MESTSTAAPREFWRWLLHECVRANPLYVLSALLLAYAVMGLNAKPAIVAAASWRPSRSK